MFVPLFVAISGLTGERAWLGQCGPLVSFWEYLGLCSWLSAVCSLLSWFGFVYLFVVCLEETGQADCKVYREEKMIITDLRQQEG